jgi:Type VI secretion system/phage-baseplate injector OB domain
MSIVGIMQQIAAREAEKIYTTELGEVTAIFPHSSDGDQNNYQCSVKLKNRKGADGSDFELRKVPVASGHIGLVNIPNVGDLVLIQFIGGDLNAPVITGRLYNDKDKPTVGDKEQINLDRVESIKIEMKGGTTIEVDKDGNVKITAKGDVIINEGSNGAARKDDSVEVTIPSGSFIISVAGGGGSPAVGTPNPGPVKVQGKITSASGTVKIGD